MTERAGIVYDTSSLMAVIDEIKPLILHHWHEVEDAYGFGKPDINYEQYKKLDEAGVMHVVTARKGGKLIGYCVSIVMPHMHYQTRMMAMNDGLFVLPQHRKGSVGTWLIVYAENELRNYGIDVFFCHVKIAHDFGHLLERLGYECIEKNYMKVLTGG
jgi:GNAT superfamily N-acetyltransferase